MISVGDIVQLRPESTWANGTQSNPVGIDGVILDIFHDDESLNISVKWTNGTFNRYRAKDLMKISDNKSDNTDERPII